MTCPRERVSNGHPRRRGQTFELPVAFPLPSASCVVPGYQPVNESVNKVECYETRLWISYRMACSQSHDRNVQLCGGGHGGARSTE
ncbi:hypothetical protein PITC_051310 [Penicillium italicum]|uniref:Uncharacterized protein n=1 Tax=Penicillium italicum TaxID=40296 RepID=A0A0A2KX20_PENIT|nr:hypothetical protein PITC_051310 [Penicillium italicum]